MSNVACCSYLGFVVISNYIEITLKTTITHNSILGTLDIKLNLIVFRYLEEIIRRLVNNIDNNESS